MCSCFAYLCVSSYVQLFCLLVPHRLRYDLSVIVLLIGASLLATCGSFAYWRAFAYYMICMQFFLPIGAFLCAVVLLICASSFPIFSKCCCSACGASWLTMRGCFAQHWCVFAHYIHWRVFVYYMISVHLLALLVRLCFLCAVVLPSASSLAIRSNAVVLPTGASSLTMCGCFACWRIFAHYVPLFPALGVL